ncbi:MAG: PQQ-dependent sugar dehydrogenase, partial [bacterium]
MRRADVRSGVLAVIAVLAIAAGARAQSSADPTLVIHTILPPASLVYPTTLAFLGVNDFLVLEKTTGNVRRVLGGVLQPAPVLTVPVDFDNERGLLGIAINHESPPKVFLYFSEAATQGGAAIANRVYRYTWNAATSLLVSPTLVLDLPVTPGHNHNGGVLLLGPPGQFPGTGDGAVLHVVIGELNRTGQLQNNVAGAAPDDTGVIFRVLQNGSAAPGNPFTPYCSLTTTQTCTTSATCPGGQTCRTQVARYYAYGIRNSFGLALDPLTGQLWDTENGPTVFDEVNRVQPGMNSGWTDLMGPDALDPEGVGDLFNMPGAGSTYSDPEFSWQTTIAPTAIVFPYGSTLGAPYDAAAIVADDNNGILYALPLNSSRTGFALTGALADLVANNPAEADPIVLADGFGAVTDLKVAPNGDLYLVDLLRGAIYSISG